LFGISSVNILCKNTLKVAGIIIRFLEILNNSVHLFIIARKVSFKKKGINIECLSLIFYK